MQITKIPCDQRYEKIVPITVFRCGAYFSRARQHILFTPLIQTDWDPQDPDCCYHSREPVTMLPINSAPETIGNRIRAMLFCSRPLGKIQSMGKGEILQFFQNIPDKEALFAEQNAQGIPPFLKSQGRVIDRLVSIGINQFGIQRVGSVSWNTQRFPRSELDMWFTYERCSIYATPENYLFLGAIAAEFQHHPDRPDAQCYLINITATDAELGELALMLWHQLDAFREKLSKS